MGSLTLAIAAVAFAAVMQWRNWSWKWNLGIRLASLAVLYAGTVVNAVTGGPLREAVAWLGEVLGTLLGAIIGLVADTVGVSVPAASAIGDAVGGALPWLVGAILAVLWIAALLPDRLVSDKLDWTAMWFGLPIPVLVPAIPGQLGETLDRIVTSVGEWGGSVIGTLVG